MPALFFMRLFFVFILFLSSVEALPVGNPADASIYYNGILTDPCAVPCNFFFPWTTGIHLRTGFYGDYVFERYLTRLNHRRYGGYLYNAQMNTNALLLVANSMDWIEVFATAGESEVFLLTDSDAQQRLGSLYFTPSASFSGGMRATVFRMGPFYIGGEAQYLRTAPRVGRYFDWGSGSVTYFNGTNRTDFEEWQIGFGGTWRVETARNLLAPYLALKVSNMRADLRDIRFISDGTPETLFDLTASHIWGFAVGMSWLLDNQIGCTVEGRFGDEQALYVSGQITW